MPTPSKATDARRRLIVALLGAGASQRRAAVAGVHHSQISRWVERGHRHPGGRFSEFAAAVERAEASPILSALPEIAEPVSAADLRWALSIVQPEWQ